MNKLSTITHRIYKTILVAVVIWMASLSASFAQANATVGLLIREAEMAAEELINRGFDRLDMSMVQAGYEAQSTVDALRVDLENVLETTADTLDEQRSRLVSDLQLLTRSLSNEASGVVAEVSAATDRLTSTAVVLLDDGIGTLRVSPGLATVGDDYFEVALRGIALSQLSLEDFSVGEKATDVVVVTQDDSEMLLRVAVPEGLATMPDANGPAELQVNFSVHKPRWFEFFRGRALRNFATVAVFVPEQIESITAVYSGQVISSETRSRRETRGTPRAQTSVGGFPPRLRRGRWSGQWAISASEGGRIDTSTIRHRWDGNSGCHGSSTRTRLISSSASAFSIGMDIVTDRKVGATCRATAIITFNETFSFNGEGEHAAEQTEIPFGQRAVFSRADVPETLLEPRVAYFEIRSILFDGGMKRLLPNEVTTWATVTADPATGFDFVTVKLR